MHILFGLDFDHKLPEKPQTRIGYVCTGPSGLLSILETQLGLIQAPAAPLERLLQYQACLKALDNENRFYHRSFMVDEIAVARTLLDWRDQWYLAGWNGSIDEDAASRLQDMAEVENLARSKVSACLGERLQAVLERLATRRTRIKEIATVDLKEDQPNLWQQVLAKLPVNELDIDRWPPSGRPDTDLFGLQQRLIKLNQGETVKEAEVPLKGDGSVLVIKARSRATSAKLLAEYMRVKNTGPTLAIVAGNFGAVLDDALEIADEPRIGFHNFSDSRPAFQVLPMALALLWEPLDPALLLQFLTHPVGPLPARVRSKLALSVVQAPGIGSTIWNEQLQRIIATEKKRHHKEDKDIDKLLGLIEYWLQPQRFDPDKGAPAAIQSERCTRIAGWLESQIGAAQEESVRQLFASARSQALALAEALDSLRIQGTETISRQQQERLLGEAIGSGSPTPDKPGEAARVCASDSPSTFVDPFEEIAWWDLSMPQLPAPYPWSQKELSDLLKQGVQLQSLDDILRRLARGWMRPIMSAQERLILVKHDSDDSNHPIWDQISICGSGWKELDAEICIQTGGLIPKLGVESYPIAHRPLPGLKRWWELKDGQYLKRRPVESYTSLDRFIKSPYQWVLAHKAGLYRGGFDELVIDNRLRGTLAHRLFEDFFSDRKDWKDYKAKMLSDWVRGAIGQLLEQEGALLLAPGKVMERERFTEIVTRALVSLVHWFKNAKIQKIDIEAYQKGRFKGGDLHGYIDMLLVNHADRECVLDVKWHGLGYRALELEKNAHLQLAVYANLRRQTSGSAQWSEQAYYIADVDRIISQSRSYCSEALVFKPDDGEDADDLWQQFETTWDWRRSQLDEGRIEITVNGTEPDRSSEPPENGKNIEAYNDRFNDYATLTGWEKEA